MSEFKIVSPEQAKNSDPISSARKLDIVQQINDGILYGEREFYFRPRECEFVRKVASECGWDVSVHDEPFAAPKLKLVISPATDSSST